MVGFIARLRIYSEIPPIPAVAAIIIKMTVEILSVLALATKQVQHVPFSAGPSARGHKEITEVDARYNENQTVLHIASQHGDLEVMRWLFEREATMLLLHHGAEVDHRNWQERTSLHGASESGHENVSRVLLNHGASVDAEGVYKWTPLHLASRAGNSDIAKLLLHHGANVDARNDLGWTPLHMASQMGNLGVVKLLLTLPNPAAVNAQKADGETALHLAAYYGHPEVARTLLYKGASLDIRNKAGKESLDLARLKGHQKVEELL